MELPPLNVLLQGTLLAVLLTPLLGALLAALTRGRLAGLLAAAHVGLAAALAVLTFGGVIGRGDRGTHRGGMRAEAQLMTFGPTAVPGDPGTPGIPDSDSYTTAWTLLPLGPATDPGVPPPAVQFFIGADGLNVWLVALASVMTLVAVLTSTGRVRERPGAYFAWLFLLQFAVTGAFLAFDIVLFYVFFELTLVPAFFLIGHWGPGRGRRDAAKLFFLYTLLGSLVMLVGIVGVVLANPTPLHPTREHPQPKYDSVIDAEGWLRQPVAGPLTFSIPQLVRNASAWGFARLKRENFAQGRLAEADAKLAAAGAALAANATPELGMRFTAATTQRDAAAAEVDAATADRSKARRLQVLLLVLLMAGFAVKTPIVPFHTWLPTTYAEAPIAVTMLLAAVLSKLGTYGILRVVLPTVPDAAAEYGLGVFGVLGAIGIVYGAFCAYGQRDLRLLAAYSSVSHLGLLVLGLFSFNTEGLTGASLHMVNHGLATGALFALIGFLEVRHGTTDMSQYGGLIARYPCFAFLFVLVSLANVGLPFLNNFVSEMLIVAGLFDPSVVAPYGYGLAVAAVSGIFLATWYTFTMLRRVLFGPEIVPPLKQGVAAAMALPEALGYLIPAGLCVVLGVYPQLLLDTIRGDAAVVAQQGDFARFRLGRPTSTRLEDDPAAVAAAAEAVAMPRGPGGPGGPPGGPPGAPPR
jgi:NADH-quinone oxidoreductase subunit M